MDADDHALVHRRAVLDEQPAPLLEREQRVGDRRTRLVADQHAVVALGDLALDHIVAVEDMAHETRATGHGHELALEADQTARRDAVLEADTPLAPA